MLLLELYVSKVSLPVPFVDTLYFLLGLASRLFAESNALNFDVDVDALDGDVDAFDDAVVAASLQPPFRPRSLLTRSEYFPMLPASISTLALLATLNISGGELHDINLATSSPFAKDIFNDLAPLVGSSWRERGWRKDEFWLVRRVVGGSSLPAPPLPPVVARRSYEDEGGRFSPRGGELDVGILLQFFE